MINYFSSKLRRLRRKLRPLRQAVSEVIKGRTAANLRGLESLETRVMLSGEKFDFGLAISPLEPGFVAINNGAFDSPYSALTGYGWLGGSDMSGRDRASGSALLRDLNIGTHGTFAIDVANGVYDVKVYIGDPWYAHDQQGLYLEGELVETFNTVAGQTAIATFQVQVLDGQLTVGLQDLGGSDPNMTIQALEYDVSSTPLNQKPTIASLTAAPEPVVGGTDVLLTANNVADADGTIASVSFYRESNGSAGLQTGAGGDLLVGSVTSGNFELSVSTTGLPAGSFTYYAFATDDLGAVGARVQATSTVAVNPANLVPTLGSLTSSDATVTRPNSFTLTANGVADSDGVVSSVSFYRESNGTPGLQTGAGGDVLLASDASAAYEIVVPTAALPAGVHTLYAQAKDNFDALSPVASVDVTVEAGIGGLKFDFGYTGTPVADGYIPIDATTAYSSQIGYGWLPGGNFEGRDRQTGNALLRDLNLGSQGTFAIDVSNGVYDVKVYIGDPWYARDQQALYLEGELANTFATAAGQSATATFQVQVLDGQLTVRLQDLGGIDLNMAIQGLEYAPSTTPLNQKPTIGSLTAVPEPVIGGSNVLITADNVADADGTVASVAFYRESNGSAGLQTGAGGDLLLGTVTTGAYELSASTTGLAAGSYTYYAQATDNNGAMSLVAQVAGTIEPNPSNVAPTLTSLTSSAGSVTIPDSFTLTANGAADSDGSVASVTFYRESNGSPGLQTGAGGDTLLGSDTAAPYSVSVSSASLAAGSHTFYAQAADNFGALSNVATTLVSVAASSSGLKFDFGYEGTPVAAGYIGISHTTAYSPALGYGWQAGHAFEGRDRQSSDPLLRDLNIGTQGTFAVDLANGLYDVKVYLGDPWYAHDQMGVSLEGTQVDSVTNPVGQTVTVTYSVQVSDGQLNVGFLDLGGSDPNVTIQGLEVRAVAGNTAPVIASLTASPSPVARPAIATLTAGGVTDAEGTVASVQFYQESNNIAGLQTGEGGDTLLSSDTSSPYSVSFATGTMDLGTYTFYAYAIDDEGAVGATRSVSLVVQDPQPDNQLPSIGSLAVNPGSVSAGASATLTANSVTDPDGTVSSVSFYRESNNLPGLQTQATTATIKVMPLGDSITAGNSIPGGYRTKLFADLVNAGFGLDFVGSATTNPDPGELPDADHNGYANHRIDQLDANVVAWVQAANPDVVLLHAGTVDIAEGFGIASIRDRLTGLITKITSTAPNAKVLVSNLIPMALAGDESVAQAEFNPYIQGIVATFANAGKQVYFVDMHSALDTGTDYADFYHPNQAGFDKMATVWQNAMTAAGIVPTSIPADASVGTDGTSPFSISASTASLSTGSHVFYATATDNQGGVSAAVSTTLDVVANQGPAITSLTASPSPVAQGGSLTLSANANDPDGSVASVAFYLESNGTPGLQTGVGGDTAIGADTTSPFSIATATGSLSQGTHLFYAVATDNAGASSEASQVAVQVTPAPQNVYKFDFGTASSPVAAGYTRVSEATTYNSTQGYGWQGGTITSRDRGGTDALTRDLLMTTGGVFAADVTAGLYDLTIVWGDPWFDHDQMGLIIQGSLVDTVTVTAGTPVTKTYRVTVSGDQLRIVFDDLGGSDPNTTIQGITIDRVSSGLNTAPTLEGLTALPDPATAPESVTLTPINPADADGLVSTINFYRETNGVPGLQVAPDRPVRIMPLGDSITDGWNVAGGYRTKLYNDLTAAGMTVDFVGDAQSGTATLPDPDHSGHPGFRIDELAMQANAWLAQTEPDVVLLHIGTNDILQNYDLANIGTRLNNLITQIATYLPDAHIVVAQITRLTQPAQDALVQQFNALIPGIVQAQAALGRKVSLVDMYTPLSNSDIADTVHPNLSGYEKMATQWQNAILTSGAASIPSTPDTLLGSDGSSPFALNFGTTGLAAGGYTYYAVATDNQGAKSGVASVNHTLISDVTNSLPVVSTLTGTPNPVLQGSNVTLDATANDPDGAVAGVAFYRESNGVAGLQTSAGPKTVKIMPLGDSITNGYTVPGGYRTKLYQDLVAAGYGVDFVGASQANPDPGDLPDADHNGYNGYRIDQIDSNVQAWIDATQPDIILLHIGTNDIDQAYGLSTIRDRLASLITKITSRAPNAHLIVTNIIPIGISGAEATAQTEYNAYIPGIVQTFVDAGKHVSFLDMHSVVDINTDYIDLYHPNQAGSDKIADAWFGAIAALVQPEVITADTPLGSDLTAPYSNTFSTAGLEVGDHVFYAVATDNLNATGIAASVTVAVSSTQVNNPPTIASLTGSPSPVTRPDTLTLTAGGVADADGVIASVAFYRESNGAAGLQTGAGGDTLIVADNASPYSASLSTGGIAAGSQVFYAVATDDDGATSSVVSTTVQVNEGSTGLKFDFGLPESPVQSGYLAVTGTTAYSAAQGYGWIAGSNFEGRDRQGGTNLLRDLNIGTDGTWAIDLPNGLYEVKLYIGDPWYAHDQMAVFLEGTQVDSITTTVGQSVTRIFQVQVSDGQLTARFRDLGGSDPNMTVQGMEVTAIGPVNPAPTIGSLLASPDPVDTPNDLTLTAENVADSNGTIASVAFYRETNGTAGLQTGAGGDTLIATDSDSVYSTTFATGSLAAGSHTFYAVATDNEGATSAVVSKTVTVANPAPTIGSLSASPDPVEAPAPLTLTAGGVADSNGAIASVAFYRESNGAAGLQIGAGGDLLISSDATGPEYAAVVDTASLPAGSYTFYAIATDNLGAASAVVSTTAQVNSAVQPNQAPSIGSLSASPASLTIGGNATLTANSVADTDGTIDAVAFYRESNGVAGLQIGAGGDAVLGSDNSAPYSLTFSTAGLTEGAVTYYAVAADNLGAGSNVVSATQALNAPPAAATYKYDFGTDTSPLEAGFTRVIGALGSPNSLYNATAGFGWLSGSLFDSRDRGGGGTSLTRDLTIGASGTFAVDLPNGAYEVKVHIGDPWFAHDLMGVFIEGVQVDSVTTTAGQSAAKIYSANVTDGQLTLRIQDLGGSDPNAVIQGLEITASGPVNQNPTIGAFSATPSSVATPGAVTLSATDVADADGVIASVAFYRESNGTAGLQTGAGGDTLVASFTSGPFDHAFTTESLAVGTYTYHAQATDDQGGKTSLSTTLNVTNPAPTLGSLSASSNPVTAPVDLVLTAVDAADVNGAVASVAFYRESNGTAGLQTGAGGDVLIATDSAGPDFTAIVATASMPAATYMFYAVATDNLGATSAPATVDVAIEGNPANQAPTIGTFAPSPASVASGALTTLTAGSVADADGVVLSVSFYRESNSVAGLQTGAGGDTLLGSDNSNPYSLNYLTTGLAAGSHIFYAVAVDDLGAFSAAASTTLTITAAQPGPLLKFDFNDLSNINTAGYTGVWYNTLYDPLAGYGWSSGTIESRDRNTASSLLRDFNRTADGTFVLDSGIGTHRITVTLGDAWNAIDQAGIYVEGNLVDTLSTSSGQFITRSYEIFVADTQVTLRLKDLGGSDPWVSIAALEIQQLDGQVNQAPTIGAFTGSPSPAPFGSTITLAATGVADVDGSVTSVAFYRESNGTAGLQTGAGGDTLLASNVAEPFSTDFSTAGLAAGTYTFYARATDNQAAGVTATTTVVINPNTPPTIGSLTASPDPATSPETLTLSALGVTDAEGTVVSVAFHRESNGIAGLQTGAGGDTLIGTDVTSEAWEAILNIDALPTGSYTWYATATDVHGATSTAVVSSAVSTPIPANAAPTIDSLTADMASVIIPTPVVLTANNPADTDGAIQSVSFYRESNGAAGLQTGVGGDTLLSSLAGGPFTHAISTNSLPAGTYTYYALAIDNFGGTSAAVSTSVTTRVNAAPTIASFSALPLQVLKGTDATLSAAGVADPDLETPIASVNFYRESNGVAGLQTGSGGDALIASDTTADYIASLPTGALDYGYHTVYAQAVDSLGLASAARSTTFVVYAGSIGSVTRFDFGSPVSPVEATYTRITPQTVYSPLLGFGWSSGVIDERTRNGVDALRVDFNTTSNGVFSVDLINGTYDVTITTGDAWNAHDQSQFSLEGVIVDNISTAGGSFVTRTYRTQVTDGQLNLRIQDLGGANPDSVINGLTIVDAFPTNVAPTVSAFTALPDPVISPNNVNLEVDADDSDGAVARVNFYRETNGTPGLQIGEGGDELVVSDIAAPFSASFSTISIGASTQTFYAQAIDNVGRTSAVSEASTTVRTAGPTTRFDFGTASSPVAPGYTRITEISTYDLARGFGWTAPAFGSTDAGGADLLNRDFVSITDSTFQLDLPNGTYNIIVTMSDPAADHDQIRLSLEGAAVETLDVAAAQNITRSYLVDVTDGQLTFRIEDLGGASATAVINTLRVNLLPSIGSLTATPAPQYAPYSVSLGVSGAVDPDGAVASVSFYRESNGTAGLQTGVGGDTFLGVDATAEFGMSFSTLGLAPAVYTYYAVPTDNDGSSGAATTTTHEIRASYNFDFGTATSAVQPGFTQVTEATVYTPALGYGWHSGVVISDDRNIAGVTAITRDNNSTTFGTFAIDVPNGLYEIQLTTGDAFRVTDNGQVYAEGNLVALPNTAANQFATTTLQANVTDGQLSLSFYDMAGVNPEIALSSLEVRLITLGPAAGAFTATPASQTIPGNVTLSLAPTDSDGTVASTTFYRESNGVAGLQLPGHTYRVMPLGDSLTHGWFVPGGYRTRLYNLLTTNGVNIDFVGDTNTNPDGSELPDIEHSGQPGWTIDEIQARAAGWVDSAQPSVVLLMIGTNDVLGSRNAGITDRLTTLIQTILDAAPSASVVLSSIPPLANQYTAPAAAYNAAMPGIAAGFQAAGKSVFFVDAGNASTLADMSDLIHPNQAGMDRIADAWYAGIMANNLVSASADTFLGADTAGPYEYVLDTSGMSPGTYTFYSFATDNAGSRSPLASVAVDILA